MICVKSREETEAFALRVERSVAVEEALFIRAADDCTEAEVPVIVGCGVVQGRI